MKNFTHFGGRFLWKVWVDWLHCFQLQLQSNLLLHADLTCALVVDALSGAFILDACCKCYITPYIVVTVCRHFHLMIFLAYLSTHDCVTTGFTSTIDFFHAGMNSTMYVELYQVTFLIYWGRFSKIKWSTAMGMVSVMVKLQVTGWWRVKMDSGQPTSLQKNWMCSKGATHMSGTFVYYFIAFCTLSCAYLLTE